MATQLQRVHGGNSSTDSTTATTGTLGSPATAGNLLVAHFAVDKSAGTFTPPVGWTVLADVPGASVSTLIVGKLAAGGETSVSISWTTPAPNGQTSTLIELGNINAADPFGPITAPAYSDTGRTSLALDPGAAESAGLALAFLAIDSANTSTAFQPAATGWTLDGTGFGGGSGFGPGVAVLSRSVAAGEDLGSQTFSWTPLDQTYGAVVLVNSALASTSTLTDDFATADSTKWFGYENVYSSVVGGQLVQQVNSAYAASVGTLVRYSLVDSAAHIRLVQRPNIGNGSTEAIFSLELDTNNWLRWYITGSDLLALRRVAGVTTTVATVPYNATTHQRLRIRESGGTIFWDTYDGTTWTQRGSWVNSGLAVTTMKAIILAGYWGTESNPGTVIWDDFNVGAPLGAETWTGTTGAAWPAQWTVTGSGTATIQSNTGQFASGSAYPYSSESAWLGGMPTASDCEVLFTFSPPASGEWILSAYGRTQDAYSMPSNAGHPSAGFGCQIKSTGAGSPAQVQIGKVSTADTYTQVGFANVSPGAATSYKVRMRLVGGQFDIRVWNAANAEPSTWTASATDASPYLKAGRLWLCWLNGADGVNRTVTLDNLTVTPVTTPPFAVRQRAKAVTPAAATSLTVTLPGAATVGSTQVLVLTTSSGSGLAAVPTGWTQRATDGVQSNNIYLLDHTTSATTDTSVTLTFVTGAATAYLVEAVGVTGFGSATSADGAGPSASYSTDSLTPDVTSGASWLIVGTAYDTNTATAFSAPVTLAAQDFVSIAGESDIHSAYADGVVTSASAVAVTVTPAASAVGWETVFGSYRVVTPAAPAGVTMAGVTAASAVRAPAGTVSASDTTAPSVPTGLNASASATTVGLGWNASTDAVGVASYRVRRGGVDVPGATALTGTFYFDTGLTVKTTYSYTVSAVDAAGNRSAESSALAVTTPRDSPNSVAARSTGPSTVRVRWESDPTATSYRVRRGGVDVPGATALTGTSYVVTGLSPSTTYSFTVSSVDSSGDRSTESSGSSARTHSTPPPGVPSYVPGSTTYLDDSFVYSSQHSVPVPPGVAVNDVVVVHYQTYGANGQTSVTPPAGFTELTFSPALTLAANADGNLARQRVFWKRLTAVDTGTYVFNHPTTDSPHATVDATASAFRGCITTGAPVEVLGSAVQATEGTQTPAVSGTTTASRTLLYSNAGASLFAPGVPSAWDISNIDSSVNSAYLYKPTPGATGTVQPSAGFTNDRYTVSLVALVPPPDTTAPSVPTGVTATANTSTQVTVSWIASTDAIGVASYRVRQGGVDVTGATAVTGTSAVITGLSPGTAYSFTASAVDATGNRSAESAAANVTTPPPVTMAGVTAASAVRAPAGTVFIPKASTNAGVTGRTATAAPAGTVTAGRSATLAGVVAPAHTAAPAGTVGTAKSAVLAGAVARVNAAAPAGAFFSPSYLGAGVVAQSAVAAPAGSVDAGWTIEVTAPEADVALAAPAGAVWIWVPTPYTAAGAVARAWAVAPEGAVLALQPFGRNLAGPPARLTVAAWPGYVTPDGSRDVIVVDESGFDITVYSNNYATLGRIGDYISASVTWEWLAAGTGEIVVPADHWVVPVALTCNTTVVPVVIEVNGIRWTGRIASAQREHGADGTGTATLSLVDDWAWLQSVLAWPTPTAGIVSQTNAKSSATGKLATVSAALINDNMARLAAPVLALAPITDTSATVVIEARMELLSDYLVPLFQVQNWNLSATLWLPGDPQPVGYYAPLTGNLTRVPSTLSTPTVLITPTPNLSKPWVRWDDTVGGVITDSVGVVDPKGYKTVLAGSGSGTARIFAQYIDSVLGNTLGSYGFPEVFAEVSQGDTLTAVQAQGPAEASKNLGAASVAVTVQDGMPWRFGRDYFIGDMPRVELSGVALIDKPVTSVTASDQPDSGLVLVPTIGDNKATATSDAMIVDVVQRIAAQVRRLQTGK